jgi:acyl carrier protein
MMEEKVRAILREHSGLGDAVQQMTVHDSLWLMGMTSAASVEVMVALESAFGFEFPDERLRHATFASVYNIVRCIRELTGSGVR